MMSEIKQIESTINPTETFLVADSLTGQVAAEVAKEFKNTVNLTGIILTRADGDAKRWSSCKYEICFSSSN